MSWEAPPASNQSPIHMVVQEPSFLWCGSWAVLQTPLPETQGSQSLLDSKPPVGNEASILLLTPRFYQDQEPPRCHFWILHRLLSTFMEIFRVVTKPPSRPWLFSCSLEVPLASMFVWLVDNLRPEKNNGNPAISFSLGQQHGLVYMERALPKFFSLSIVWSREFAPTF